LSEISSKKVPKVKMVFFTNPMALEEPGGAEIYMDNLMRGLRVLGYTADFYNGNSLARYDAALFVNSIEYGQLAYHFIKKAKEYNKLVFNIPIYWDLSSIFTFYEKTAYTMLAFILKKLVRWTKRPVIRHLLEYTIRSMLESSIVLVSGEKERQLLISHFGIPFKKVKVLPICVNRKFYSANSKLFEKKYGIKNFILFVGHRMRRKNVHRLLEAYSKTKLNIPLVIIGSEHDRDYLNKLKVKIHRINSGAMKDKKVFYIGNLNPASELLASAYAAAKVFVLPSYYETPGIAALEAALAGANIAITEIGTTKEYFREYAQYINPYSVKSIKEAIEKAYYMPRDKKLKEFVYKNYSEVSVAKKLVEFTRFLDDRGL